MERGSSVLEKFFLFTNLTVRLEPETCKFVVCHMPSHRWIDGLKSTDLSGLRQHLINSTMHSVPNQGPLASTCSFCTCMLCGEQASHTGGAVSMSTSSSGMEFRRYT